MAWQMRICSPGVGEGLGEVSVGDGLLEVSVGDGLPDVSVGVGDDVTA